MARLEVGAVLGGDLAEQSLPLGVSSGLFGGHARRSYAPHLDGQSPFSVEDLGGCLAKCVLSMQTGVSESTHFSVEPPTRDAAVRQAE